jgi:hypothetical protein
LFRPERVAIIAALGEDGKRARIGVIPKVVFARRQTGAKPPV